MQAAKRNRKRGSARADASVDQSVRAYNRPVVIPEIRLRWRQIRWLTAGAVLAALCALAAAAGAQAQPGGGDGAPSSAGGRVLLVLPFDNRTGQPSLEWIREAAAEILSMRFAAAGFEPTSRADRTYALDHLGLPQGFQPSRA